MPCLHLNDYFVFRSLLIHFENNLCELNKKFFLAEKYFKKTIVNNTLDLDVDSLTDSLTNSFNLTANCDSVDCYFEKTKGKLDASMLWYEEATIDFKLEFFKNVHNFSFDFKRNLSNLEVSCLLNFIKEKPFKICELDKNIGIGIIDNKLYDSLCVEFLSNPECYEKIQEDPLLSSCNKINNKLLKLLNNKNISKKLFSKIKIDHSECKVGSFRILPKIHKDKFSIRPIVNCLNHFTSHLCLLVDVILRPFVVKCESFIKDSQHLLQETLELFVPEGYSLLSGDFDSLYNNIILETALDVICDFVKNDFHSQHINIIAFRKILEIIFKFNIFKYKNVYYRQIKGIAMGSKCGPSIANVVVYIFEKKFLHIHRYSIIFYKRFIDDIFLIIKDDFDVNLLLNSFGNLKLNIVKGTTVNFLDLVIFICKISRKLKFKLYIKPTNTFCYLPCHSNHPSFIFINSPKGIFMRAKRICSYFSDFLYYSRIFFDQLLNRGYDRLVLRKTLNMVSNLNREDLIKYKEKENFLDSDSIFFKFPFDFNFLNSEKIFIESFNNIKNKYNFLENKNLKIVNYMQPNLGRLLVHNFQIDMNYFKLFRYRKCFNSDCSTCFFGSSDYYLKLKNNFLLPICINSNCKTKGFIYIIKCSLCPFFFYIGESGRTVEKRMYEHIQDIKNFKPFYKSKNVSFHFNLFGHNYLQHLSFYIFIKNCDDVYIRLMYEKQLVYIFENLDMKLLNDDSDRLVDIKRFRRNNFKNMLNFDETY